MEKYYGAIRKGLSQTEQTSIFSASSDFELTKACVDFLKYKGYGIKEPVECVVKDIDTIDKLIGYFYDRLRQERPEYKSVYVHETRDRMIAKRFIMKQQDLSGLSYQAALKECVEIVKTVLDHYDEFHFKFQINFSIFGNDKLGWVTDRAIEIINKKYKAKREDDYQKKLDSVIAHAAKDETFGYDDLDALLEQLEEENKNG
jgi:hypothetical protein